MYGLNETEEAGDWDVCGALADGELEDGETEVDDF